MSPEERQEVLRWYPLGHELYPDAMIEQCLHREKRLIESLFDRLEGVT
jgi:hypothetical protein